MGNQPAAPRLLPSFPMVGMATRIIDPVLGGIGLFQRAMRRN